MAENAPLTGARAHASNAAKETEQIHWDEAADEHSQAAAEYSRAAKTTGDSEALRVLKLLEAQHQKLARIIKSQDTIPLSDHFPDAETASDTTQPTDAASTPAKPADDKATPKRPSTTSALAAARLSTRNRDSSPSLARDIASRRGIPQASSSSKQLLSPAAQARARHASPSTHRQPPPQTHPPPQIPPSIMTTSRTSLPKPPPSSDDAFNAFYTSLTTNTISKLSSALAYAGLPLNPSAPPPPTLPPPKPRTRTVPAPTDPDITSHFSPAALKALSDPHHSPFGPAESFYLVQPSGGTYSYADITRAEQRRQNLAGDEEDDEAFVDAREAQQQVSSSANGAAAHRTTFGKTRTPEELELENTTLKSTLETLAARLANFEAHAQEANFEALTQSMSLHPAPQHAQPPDEAMERIRVLEEQIREDAEKRGRLEQLAQKQERKIRLYHEKWEGVKKSARDKERVRREAAGAEE